MCTRWQRLAEELDALAFGDTWFYAFDGEPPPTLIGFASRYSQRKKCIMKSHRLDGGMLFVRVDREFAPQPPAVSASPARDLPRRAAAAGCGQSHEAA